VAALSKPILPKCGQIGIRYDDFTLMANCGQNSPVPLNMPYHMETKKDGLPARRPANRVLFEETRGHDARRHARGTSRLRIHNQATGQGAIAAHIRI